MTTRGLLASALLLLAAVAAVEDMREDIKERLRSTLGGVNYVSKLAKAIPGLGPSIGAVLDDQEKVLQEALLSNLSAAVRDAGDLEPPLHVSAETQEVLDMVGAEDGMVVPEPGTEQEEIWVNAANVASYVELRMPRSIEVPVHLNLVFVGFDGHGKHNLAVSDRTAEHWFKHLDSLVHHTVLGEPHDSNDPGHFGGSGYSMHRALPPRHHAHAGVHYRYKFHATVVSPLVGRALARWRDLHMRREDGLEDGDTASSSSSSKKDRLGYVDANEMGGVLTSLLRRMADESTIGYTYTLFVLNTPTPEDTDITVPPDQQQQQREPPPPGAPAVKYGYRDGFSAAEIRAIANDPTLEKLAATAERKETRAFRQTADGKASTAALVGGGNGGNGGEFAGGKQHKFHAPESRWMNRNKRQARRNGGWAVRPTDAETELHPRSMMPLPHHLSPPKSASSPEGHGEVTDELNDVQWEDLGPVTERWANDLYRELKAYKRPSLKDVARETIEHGEPAERRALLRAVRRAREAERTGSAGSSSSTGSTGSTGTKAGGDCLVDMWVSRRRFAWLDLTAGPFTWGPRVGGVGTRTTRSIPKVPSASTIKWTQGAKALDAQARKRKKEEEATKRRGKDAAAAAAADAEFHAPESRWMHWEHQALKSAAAKAAAATAAGAAAPEWFDNLVKGLPKMRDEAGILTAMEGNDCAGVDSGAPSDADETGDEEAGRRERCAHVRQQKVRMQNFIAAIEHASQHTGELMAAAAADASTRAGGNGGSSSTASTSSSAVLAAWLEKVATLFRKIKGHHVPGVIEERFVGEDGDREVSGERPFDPHASPATDAFLARLSSVISAFMNQVVTPPTVFPVPLPPLPHRVRRARGGGGGGGGGGGSSGNDDNNDDDGGDDDNNDVDHVDRDERSGSGVGGSTASAGAAAYSGDGMAAQAAADGAVTGLADGAQGSLGEWQAERDGRTLPMHSRGFGTLAVAPAIEAAEHYRNPQRLAVHIHVVTGQRTYAPLGHGGHNFDIAEFKREILKLRNEQQETSFSVQYVSLDEDVALAVAYASSLRSAVVPTVGAGGDFSAVKRRYIDSYKLRHEILMSREALAGEAPPPSQQQAAAARLAQGWLSRHGHSGFQGNEGGGGGRGGGGGGGAQATRHIPVFIFSVDSPHPVFIDRYFRARALSDMVLVVQSPNQAWPSPFTCNGHTVSWSLADPVEAALTATAALLGGLLPPHVAADGVHTAGTLATRGAGTGAGGSGGHAATQNWLWSVGDGPASYTSSLSVFAEFHRDVVQRTNAVQALSASLSMVERAVAELRHIRTNKANAQVMLPFHGRFVQLRKAHFRVLKGWRKILGRLAVLDFDAAFPVLSDILTDSKSVLQQARDIASAMDSYRCTAAAGDGSAGASGGTGTGVGGLGGTATAGTEHAANGGAVQFLLFIGIFLTGSGLFALLARAPVAKPKVN